VASTYEVIAGPSIYLLVHCSELGLRIGPGAVTVYYDNKSGLC
jgi:hypothetical protein